MNRKVKTNVKSGGNILMAYINRENLKAFITYAVSAEGMGMAAEPKEKPKQCCYTQNRQKKYRISKKIHE